MLRKSTLIALSRAIEHEALARAASPVLVGAFQHEPFYRAVEHRYRRLAQVADAAVVFADFAAERKPRGGPVEMPIGEDDALGNEWAVVIDAPGYAACLLAWEQPGVDRARRRRRPRAAASRRSGRSARTRRGAPRWSARASPRGSIPSTASGSSSCWRTARWRSRSPRRR